MVATASEEGAAIRVPPTNQRFELFESLRAIAAISVLICHTGSPSHVNFSTWCGAFTAKLYVGVTLFFLISGPACGPDAGWTRCTPRRQLCAAPGVPDPYDLSKEPDTMASHLGEHVLYTLVALLVTLPAVFGSRAW